MSDYDLSQDFKTWKKFKHFKETEVLNKIEMVCQLLAKYGASSIISNSLLDVIENNLSQKIEAIFLLNEVVIGEES